MKHGTTKFRLKLASKKKKRFLDNCHDQCEEVISPAERIP